MSLGYSQTDAGTYDTGSITIDTVAPPIPGNAPIASGTFDPPDGNVGTSYFYATVGLFTGGAPTSYSLNGTLPAGLVLNTSSGNITGTPTTEQLLAGISVTGTNISGSDTTNTADIDITDIIPVPGFPSWALPSYLGYDHMTVTSITMNTIEVEIDTGEAPFFLHASAANVTMVGTRDNAGDFLTTPDVFPYHMLEHQWLLTFNDDSPVTVEDKDTLLTSRGTNVSPYTGFISPELGIPIRRPGTYKLTLTSRGPDGVGGFVSETVTRTITVTKPTYGHAWFDGAAGNDANDGLDPHGFALTTAVYTEATGELTQAGAFTAYDHAAATAGNYTDWYNWIHVSKAGFVGWYKIASKTDNNTIVLEDKLGSDQTAVTSSDGAKQTFTGQTQTENLDTFVHCNGNQGATLYTLNETIAMNTGTYNNTFVKRFGGYNTDADGVDLTFDSTVLGSARNQFFAVRNAGVASMVSCHNVDANPGYWGGRLIGDVLTIGTQVDPVQISVDRCTYTGGRDIYGAGISGADFPVILSYWSNSFTQRSQIIAALDLANGEDYYIAVPGTTDWTLLGAADNNVGTLFTANGTSTGLGTGTANSLTELCMYTSCKNAAGRYSITNNYFSVQCDRNNFDHYIYPSGNHGHRLIAFNQFRDAVASVSTGQGPGAAINHNADPGTGNFINYISVIENFSQFCTYFTDSSGINTSYTNGGWKDMLIARNSMELNITTNAPIAFHGPNAGGVTYAHLDNVAYGTGRTKFHIMGDQKNETVCDIVVARTKIYTTDDVGSGLMSLVNLTTNNAKIEHIDNEVHLTGTNNDAIRNEWAFNLNMVINDNNFYTPNDADSFYDFPVAHKTLAQLNAESTASGNVAIDPGWTDPVNGDFT